VRRAADTWLAARPELDGLVVGFDVVAVREGRLERLGDAF
jgi:Holliday junction resolvase-like predicted endonuclease